MRPYTIRKPHYALHNDDGSLAGVIQVRYGYLTCVNMVDGRREVTASSTCMYHATNYGLGTKSAASREALGRALDYIMGRDDRHYTMSAVKLTLGEG